MVFTTEGTVLRVTSAVELIAPPSGSVSCQAPTALYRSITKPGGLTRVVWHALQGDPMVRASIAWRWVV